MKFLYKFTLFLGVVVVFSFFIQFVVFNKFFVSNTNSLLLNTNEQASKNVSMQLVENFTKIQRFLKVIAGDEEIRNNQKLLDKFNSIVPEVDVITVFNSKGDILRLSGNKHSPTALNFANRDYFKQAIKGKTYISDVFTTTRGSKVITISVPIIKKNGIDGVVVGTVRLQGTSLASMFDDKKFGENGYISVLDRHGYVVYHPDKKRIGKESVIFDEMHGKSGSKITKDSSGKDQFIGYSKVTNVNWIVAVSTPTEDIMQNKNIVNYETLLIAVVLGALIILLGVYTVRRYTKPLDQLIFSFNTLKDGKYKKINPDDYKEEFHEMVRVYNNTIESLKETHSNLEEAADIDSLTGANNRRAFSNFLSRIKQEKNSADLENIGVILLDVDNFKSLNDTYGHLAGDNILKRLTEIMKESAGKQSIFRFGGDEFVVVLRNTSGERLLSIAEEIRLKGETSLDGCTVSIGMAQCPNDTDSIDELIDFADKALYISKKSRNKVTKYS